jgi:hypothetical protein
MKRRKLIAGLGAGALGSGVAIGTGAFNTVSAERSVSVSVADDKDAFLKLEQRGEGRRSYEDGGVETVAFDIPSPDESEYGGTDPEGVGADSVYRFGMDAAHNEAGLFSVENQGSHTVEVYGTQPEEPGPEVAIFNVKNGEPLTQGTPSSPVAVGERILCGLEIDTRGVSVQEDEYEQTLTINADATGNS